MIESNRLFAGNAAAIPILWVYEEERLPVLQQTINRLQSAGLNLSLLAANEFTVKDSIAWLRPHRAETTPIRVDYETGSPDFAHAFWIRISSFDFNLRNDALDSTRVDPGTGAFLRLGGFGYDPQGKSPGIAVKWLPENYKGPLQQEDVIVSIAGTMIEDARHYAEFMEQQREKPRRRHHRVARRRGQRLETRIVIPHRDEAATARVHAEYIEGLKRDHVGKPRRGVFGSDNPAFSAHVKLSWNGLDTAASATPGCWTLVEGQAKAT
ncbi:MAG: hypothetical protein U5J83_00775 [Bryobacterales bacterium]|nr:hypothetical protein [Bryobacterales bacterium]